MLDKETIKEILKKLHKYAEEVKKADLYIVGNFKNESDRFVDIRIIKSIWDFAELFKNAFNKHIEYIDDAKINEIRDNLEIIYNRKRTHPEYKNKVAETIEFFKNLFEKILLEEKTE